MFCCRVPEKSDIFSVGIPAVLALTIYNPFFANPLIKIMNMSLEYYRFFLDPACLRYAGMDLC